MNERRQRIELVFHTALELGSAEDRERYLDKACAGEQELRQEVDDLLKAAAAADGFFREVGDSEAVSETAHSPFPVERVGDRIGRYKLLQKIGEGGCGVVYMAEQEEPVRRKVALKVIKLGMDTRHVVARFEAERQALALMDHPHIAKVFDAGMTERSLSAGAEAGAQGAGERIIGAGRPYFVMELVRGVKITDYCDENRLSTQDRLDLLIRVCQAVQHAHQKGIIHRDLKPSNILVADHDGVPVPKIIDFGIAKATTDQRLTDKTLFTAFEQFIGTPAYMSPEQARLSGLDIDTRTDIYSLGVLLYELLTGTTPFDTKQLMQSGFDEMRRVIREEAPVRPSTRLHQTQSDNASVGNRKSKIQNPKSRIDPDLDWIVLKCLEKDRNRRYETANGLAADLQRHLNHEPIVARPPSRLYEFQKTVRRHRIGFAATAAVLLALATGLAASLWQARKSEREAAKATAISKFLQEMLSSANPNQSRGPDYTVRQMLDDISGSLTNQLENQPEVEAELRDTIGGAYRDLGEGAKAQPHIERALSLRRRLFGNDHEMVAHTLVNYAWSLFEQADWQGTEREARRALEIFRKQRSSEQAILGAQWVLHKALCAMARFGEADRVAHEALALARSTPGQEYSEVPSLIHGMAEACSAQGKHLEAESLALEALKIHRRVLDNDHFQIGWALLCLGVAQKGQQKFNEAETSFREALRIFRKQYPAGHKSIRSARDVLGDVLQARGDIGGLLELARDELAEATVRIERDGTDLEAWLQRAIAGSDLGLWDGVTRDLDQAMNLSRRASLEKQLWVGQVCTQVAVRAARELQARVAMDAATRAIAVYQAMARDYPDRINARDMLANSHRQLGDICQRFGRFDDAIGHYRQAIRSEAPGKEINGGQAGLRIVLSMLLTYQGEKPEAGALISEVIQRGDADAQNEAAWYLAAWPAVGERDGRRAVECAERAVAATYRKNANSLDTLAAAYAEVGRFADAVQVEREALELVQDPKLRQEFQVALDFFLSNEPYRDHRQLGLFADSLLAAGRHAEADALARDCLKVREKFPADDWNRFDAQRILGGALLGQKEYAKSEPLLLSAARGMEQLQAKLPPEGKTSHRLASESLVRLYEATARPDEAVKWKQRVAEMDRVSH